MWWRQIRWDLAKNKYLSLRRKGSNHLLQIQTNMSEMEQKVNMKILFSKCKQIQFITTRNPFFAPISMSSRQRNRFSDRERFPPIAKQYVGCALD